jgi:hypothetical protein
MTSISGKVHFVSPWPKKDSVRRLELVLIQPGAPFSVTTLIKGFGTTVLPLAQLNYLSSDTTFLYPGINPGTYNYLGVAQLFDTNVYRDWRVVGFAHDSKDSATSYTIHAGEAITNADVYVNFDSLPRSPFTK